MPINHADHDHPNTPAARAVCRRTMAAGGDTPTTTPRKRSAPHTRPEVAAGCTCINGALGQPHLPDCPVFKDGARATPRLIVEPRAKQRRMADRIAASSVDRKHADGMAVPRDLLGIPAYMAEVAKFAWGKGWAVTYGDSWTADVRKLRIHNADTGTIGLVWSNKSPGMHALWFRPNGTSQQQRYDSVNELLRIAQGGEA